MVIAEAHFDKESIAKGIERFATPARSASANSSRY
jgi:hypothetical protein